MNKLKIKKGAFTLVELIVVITILAILGTIAFISLQGYSKDARNSIRTSDMSSMKTSLELFQLDSGKYPLTTDGVVITFSGAEVWNQGVFGTNTFKNIGKLDKIPTDPLTNRKYIYSTTFTRQEYELAGVIEGSETSFNNSIINESFAGDKLATLSIKGNYNRKISKVSTGGVDYLLALPSLISSTGATSLEIIIANDMLAYDGYKNLPFQYINSPYNSLGEESTLSLVNNTNYIVYQGDITLLSKSENSALRKTLIDNLQTAYTGTIIKDEGQIQSILSANPLNSESIEKLSTSIVNNNLGGTLTTNNNPVITDGTTTAGIPTLDSKTSTSLDLAAGTFTDTDGVQNITVELYSDIGLTSLIGADTGGIFSGLTSGTTYYGVTKGEAYNLSNTSWEVKRSLGFTIATSSVPSIVSLMGTNSLTTANFTTSSVYNSQAQDSDFGAPGVFDGYRIFAGSPFLAGAGAIHGEGSWTSLSGANTNQWLQIAFNEPTIITEFSVYPKAAFLNRMPKDIKIQYSNDGVSFTDHESFTLTQGDNENIVLSSPTPYSNYIRLFIINNQDGVDPYVQVDEFVLIGTK